jgi:hypothetical protein
MLPPPLRARNPRHNTCTALVPRGRKALAVRRGRIAVPKGRIAVPRGRIAVPRGRTVLAVPRGRKELAVRRDLALICIPG